MCLYVHVYIILNNNAEEMFSDSKYPSTSKWKMLYPRLDPTSSVIALDNR